MNDLVAFAFEKAEQKIRTVKIDGQAWFVGNDVCYLLGYKDPTTAMRNHCKGVLKQHPLETPGGIQEMRIISQGDVLRLITNSTLPAAMRIEAWIFDEVIPTILRTGSYGKPVQNAILGSKRPLLPDMREEITAEIEQKQALNNPMDDFVMLQFGKECFETTKFDRDWVDIDAAYRLYRTYAEKPLPKEEFSIRLSDTITEIRVNLSQNRLTHCKFKTGLIVV
jgi:prophage antirepressor-like protein